MHCGAAKRVDDELAAGSANDLHIDDVAQVIDVGAPLDDRPHLGITARLRPNLERHWTAEYGIERKVELLRAAAVTSL